MNFDGVDEIIVRLTRYLGASKISVMVKGKGLSVGGRMKRFLSALLLIVAFQGGCLEKVTSADLSQMTNLSQVTTVFKLPALKIVTEVLPPYQYIRPDRSVGGMATEKVSTLFSAFGIKPDIEVMPWARAYKIAQTEANTFIYSIVRTREREHLFNWIGVLMSTKTYFISLAKRTDITINSLADLNAYHIGVKRDDVVYQYLRQHDLPEQIVLLPETETSLNMLLKQRVDIVAVSPIHLEYLCKKLNCLLSDFIYLYELKGLNNDFYLAASKNTSAKVVTLFKQKLQGLNALAAK